MSLSHGWRWMTDMHHSPPPLWGCPSPCQQHLCLLAHLLPLCLLEYILHTTNVKQSRRSTLNPIMPFFYSQPSSPPVSFRWENQTVFAHLHSSGRDFLFLHTHLGIPGFPELCLGQPRLMTFVLASSTAVNSLPQGWILLSSDKYLTCYSQQCLPQPP